MGGIAGIIQLRLESDADTHFIVATIFLNCVAEHLVFAAVILEIRDWKITCLIIIEAREVLTFGIAHIDGKAVLP